MHMRMVGQRQSPGVKHGRHADPCAEMLGSAAIVSSVSGVALEGAVKHGLVLMGDGADGRRKREDDMIIGQKATDGTVGPAPTLGEPEVVADDDPAFSGRDEALARG